MRQSCSTSGRVLPVVCCFFQANSDYQAAAVLEQILYSVFVACSLTSVLVQAGLSRNRVSRLRFSCKAVVAPATRTNGAALGAGKPVLDSPLWHESFSADSQHNTQLYRQPKSMLPNRLRLFAGTANPVCCFWLTLPLYSVCPALFLQCSRALLCLQKANACVCIHFDHWA